MHSFLRSLPLILLLAACGAQTLTPAPDSAPADRLGAECRLLEEAVAETGRRGLRVWPDVLLGCPGHEGVRATMTLAQMSATTRVANAAVAPPGVARGRPDMVYRRMITRGVPEAVARDLVDGPAFAAAVR